MSAKSQSPAGPVAGADASVCADGGVLVRLLQSQRDALVQLDALGQRQGECVRAQESGPLVELLAQRRRLIDRLSQLNDELEAWRGDRAAPAAVPADCREQAVALVAQIEQLRGQVLRRDREDAGALARRRDELGERVREVSRAGSAVRAYRAPGAADGRSRFADRTG